MIQFNEIRERHRKTIAEKRPFIAYADFPVVVEEMQADIGYLLSLLESHPVSEPPYDDQLELFLETQERAKIQLESAKMRNDKMYWQGVKDGLRRCYSIVTSDPCWDALGGSSLPRRPEGARGQLLRGEE